MPQIVRGQPVVVRDSRGRRHDLVAVSGPVKGQDFTVVWACRAEEWEAAEIAEREPDGVPWPVEDVEPSEAVRVVTT